MSPNRPRSSVLPRLAAGALGALALTLAPRLATAEPPRLTVPRVEGLTLDGKTADEGWAKAVEVPAAMMPGQAGTPPRIRVAVSGARFWIAVDAAEDPGSPIGLIALAAPEGTPAAQALQFAYSPQELRSPRWIVRGPKGAGRATYRVAAAADLARDEAWSIEAAIPFADLGVPADKPLRFAAIVKLRTPNVAAQAPAGTAFRETSEFAALVPPEGGWPTAEDVPSATDLAKEDLADAGRIDAWRRFGEAMRTPYASNEAARAALLPPLDAAIRSRPDLAMLHMYRAQILAQTGETSGLEKELAAALAAVPHLPEAEWALEKTRADAWTTRPDTQPSDYDAVFAAIAAAAKERPDALAPKIAEGVLRYRHGDFERAAELLAPIAERYRHSADDDFKATAEFSGQAKVFWEQETLFRQADARRDDLPRVRLRTSRGDVVIELFEDDVPNTVANFLWLAKKGFYDKTKFHRVIPFFMAQGGDPLSGTRPTGSPEIGTGGPGYAIRTEVGRARPGAGPARTRRHWRGVVSMANSGPDTEGSQFFVTTATTLHLEGKHTVFGRVLEGQDVVDRLLGGDELRSVEVVRDRGHEYRPTTVAGVPAPEPKASGPLARGAMPPPRTPPPPATPPATEGTPPGTDAPSMGDRAAK